MGSSNTTSPSFITITATGFVSTIAQILVLRELLALFYGNEISTGLIFTCWLIWTALGSALSGWWTDRFPPRIPTLTFLLSLLAVILPVVVLMIRSSRWLWSIPIGELPTIGKMVFVSISVTGLFCPVSGALFGICWSFYQQKRKNDELSQPLFIYLGEAAGAAVGGLIFYFVFLPYFQTYTFTILTSTLLLAVAWWILRSQQPPAENRISFLVLSMIAFFIFISTIFGSTLADIGRRLQWGQDLAAVRDTPYHNIAVIKKRQQISIFTNGLWLSSAPDILSAEHAVHPALLQHTQPKSILLLGGGIAGHIAEIFKYQEIQKIDYVEPDPELINLAEKYLPLHLRNDLHHDKVDLYHEDATRFLRHHQGFYDVILMNMGDPINAEMNRFYTKEFFEQVNLHLLPGGIFSFAVSGGEEMMGHVQARFISSIQKTLLSVFPDVLILPGEKLRFVITNTKGRLTSDVRKLSDRIHKRGLELSYIRQDTLNDILNPFRLDYMESLLAEFTETRLNKNLSPDCYFHALRFWAFQWHPRFEQLLTTIASVNPSSIWIGLTISGLTILSIFWFGRLRFKNAITLSVFLSGAVEMVLQIVLLLTFQVFEGFVYQQLALIIAFFMTGLGLGAGYVSWWETKQQAGAFAVSQFIRVQAMMSLFPIVLLLIFSLIHDDIRFHLSSTTVGWIFSGLSLIAGFLGGVHFSLGVLSYTMSVLHVENIGGKLYALDLTGSAAGAIIISFFVLPVYGLINTLVLLSVLSLISLLALLRHP